MKTETTTNTSRTSKCPSFDGCSSPKCPLDELQIQRVRLPEDPKCKATKKTRLLLGKDLPKRGLNSQECSGIIQSYGSVERYLQATLSKNPLSLKYKTFQRVNMPN